MFVLVTGPWKYEKIGCNFLNALTTTKLASVYEPPADAPLYVWDAYRRHGPISTNYAQIVTDDGLKIHLLLSRLRRLPWLKSTIQSENMGIIILLNSAVPELFREVSGIVQAARSDNIQFVVAAYKLRHPDAWPIDDLVMAFQRYNLSRNDFVEYVENSKESTLEVLRTLSALCGQ